MVELSTKLIDLNWDKMIFIACGDVIDQEKAEDQMQKHQEIVDIVYDRMFKNFTKELYKGEQSGGDMLAQEPRRRKKKKQR